MGGPGGPPPFAGGHGGHGGFNPGMPGGGGRQIYVSNVCSDLISPIPLLRVSCTDFSCSFPTLSAGRT